MISEWGKTVIPPLDRFLPVIWKYTDIKELNAHILNELIEKIVVHEKVVDEDGTKSQRVDIYYKFIGCVNLKREGFRDDGKIQVRNKLLQEQLEQIHSA